MSDVISIFPAKKILHALTENFTVSTLQTAMQTDPKTADLIRTLEEKYMRENNITVGKSVSEEAARYLDVDRISAVGIGLNAVVESNISLDIRMFYGEERMEAIGCADRISLEIHLCSDRSIADTLDVPVAVTLPVPDNLYQEHLELLHYKQDGIWEKEMVRDNKDGTVTFTVIDLGIFVLVKKA